jgi:hypothetical protein
MAISADVEASAVRGGTPEPGDILYVRHGDHGVRLALVEAVAPERGIKGLIQIRPWLEATGRLETNKRWVAWYDLRGWPNADDSRLREIAKAVLRGAS